MAEESDDELVMKILKVLKNAPRAREALMKVLLIEYEEPSVDDDELFEKALDLVRDVPHAAHKTVEILLSEYRGSEKLIQLSLCDIKHCKNASKPGEETFYGYCSVCEKNACSGCQRDCCKCKKVFCRNCDTSVKSWIKQKPFQSFICADCSKRRQMYINSFYRNCDD